ncbi:hypothetical protein [Absidia glauca]|uniref:DUF7721 domain-containing protein n=1 Tax=Absidia glauca TaxID=4829 RepID=A0A163TD15_ABSGL|nr:hypothetical protein [Absidia glauca]
MSYGEANSYQGAQQVSYQRPDVNESARYAAQHGGEDHGSTFSSILSSVLDRNDDDHKRPVEEHEVNHAADAHDRIYNRGDTANASSRDMGSAAALQAFKMFSSKGSGGGGGSSGGSSELIGMAMGEAMKLYKGKAAGGGGGGGGGGNQAEMLQAAAAMAMKLFASQSGGGAGSGGASHGGASGGIGALMGLLGKSGGGSSSGGGGGAASLISKFL